MSPSFAPLEVTLWQDVLCPWCFIAEQRLDSLHSEFGSAIRWRVRAYPVRVLEAVPTEKQRQSFIEAIRRARKEPEGKRLSPELWMSPDLPRSSLVSLAALEAAKLQGTDARHHFARNLQRAALEQGLNVTRPDVVLELAARMGLEMNRFAAAFGSEQTRRLVLTEHRLASERGVSRVPAVVLGNRWLVNGLRRTDEYRQLILDCLNKHVARRRVMPMVH